MKKYLRRILAAALAASAALWAATPASAAESGWQWDGSGKLRPGWLGGPGWELVLLHAVRLYGHRLGAG